MRKLVETDQVILEKNTIFPTAKLIIKFHTDKKNPYLNKIEFILSREATCQVLLKFVTGS